MAYQRTQVDSDIRGGVRHRELRRAGKASRQRGLYEGIDALYEDWALIVEG